MWLIVKSMLDPSNNFRVDGLSKLTKVETFREKLVDHFDAQPEQQMLFFRGKQLVDGHTIFDYDLGLNDTIQIMIRKVQPVPQPSSEPEESLEEKEPEENEAKDSQDSGFDDAELLENATYKLGDVIDARDTEGAWYEGELVKITKNSKSSVWLEADPNANTTKSDKNFENEDKENQSSNVENKENVSDKVDDVIMKEVNEVSAFPPGFVQDDGFWYHVLYEGYEDDTPVLNQAKDVRPRARNKIDIEKIKIGDRVMVNFNHTDPKERGYWYDALVTGKQCARTKKKLEATVFAGKDLFAMADSDILYWWEIFAIEESGSQLNKITDPDATNESPKKRKNKPDCDVCKDNPKKKCKECSCRKCGGKDSTDKQIMCDECDGAYHLWCLTPKLKEMPSDDEWFCPECKNDKSEIVQKGESLKQSKKKSKMASANMTSTRDWGQGMACVGRTKMCSTVAPNHFGPIPGIAVGTQWRFRVQVSEAGVHRPHVAGIHGRDADGAYSIVLSGGYEDDEDDGDTFTYTGAGGRDLSGNKRTAEQSCDQLLTRTNKALARNCNASIDNKNGAEAKDWKKGRPVRVIRNSKGRKHSTYAPVEGNRYDGIYKVVKYWPSKGKSGFIVWRYQFKRDDEEPAPWTKKGKAKIEELGLVMQYPDGYLDSQAQKEKEKEEKEQEKTPKGGRKRKRVIESSDDDEGSDSASSPIKKKPTVAEYEINSVVSKCIKEDKANKTLWEEALTYTKEGAQKFIAKVEEIFCCICCQDIAFLPVTTPCSHNVCKSCIHRSFKAEVYNCPACRSDIGKDFKLKENKSLRQALNSLYPGYENGR